MRYVYIWALCNMCCVGKLGFRRGDDLNLNDLIGQIALQNNSVYFIAARLDASHKNEL